MSRGMLAFLTGMGQGYMTARERKEDRDAREEDRAWKREERERTRKQNEREDTLRSDLQEAGKPVTPQDASTYQPAVDDDGNAMPVNPTAGRMSVAGQVVPPDQLDAAVTAANTPRAQAERMAGAYGKAGMMDKAMAVRTSAMQGETAEIQARQIKQADERDTKLREVGGLLARGGWGAVPKLYERYNDGYSADVTEDGKGGAIVVTKDKDGKEVARDTYADLPQLFGRVAGQFDPKLWIDGEKDRRKEGREAAKDQVEADYKGRMATVAERNAATNEAYKDQMGDAATTRANKPGASAVDRMSEADKLTYQNLSRQVQDLDKDIRSAELGGMADPAALQNYKAQKAALSMQASTLLRKYNAEPTADPAGLRGGKGGAAPAAGGGDGTRVDPAEQRRRDADRIPILEAELRNAASPEDRAALEREIARVRGQAGVRMVPTGAPAAAAPARPAVSAPMGGAAAIPQTTREQQGMAPAAAPAAEVPQFQQFLAQNITTPHGKFAIAERVKAELPGLQQAVLANAQIAQNPSMPPVARQAAAAKAEALGVQAAQMQAFMDGNPQLFKS
jgi:hypothetical protein